MGSSQPSFAGPPAHGNADAELNFDEEYYRSHLGPEPYDRTNVGMVNFFAAISDEIIRSLQPRTVLDAGCAMGFLVEALWDRGINACGLDISEYAISRVRRDIQPYCRVASLTEPIDGKYDLVVCIEVLEHMPTAEAGRAIDRLTAVTESILFSSSPTDVEEPTHVNVRQPIWWVDQFQLRGFVPDLIFDAGFVTPSAMLLRRKSAALDWETQRLYCEWLRYKNAVTERDRSAGALRSAVAEAQAASARLTTQVETIRRDHEVAQAVVGELTNAVAVSRTECGALERKCLELEEELGRREDTEMEMKAELERIALRLEAVSTQQEELTLRMGAIPGGNGKVSESGGRILGFQGEEALEILVGKHALLLATIEDLAQQRDRLLRDLEWKTNPDSSSPALFASNGVSDERIGDLLQHVATLSRTQQALQASVGLLKTQVSDILSSRIWKTFVAMGGVILRFQPGTRR